MPHPLGVVVLAGGRSRRMGRDKAALDWHGTPLVAHVVTALRAAAASEDAGPVPAVVVAAPGQALPPLPPGVLVATDPEPGRGPLMGLIAGLQALDATAAVVAATDQPFLDAGVVQPLRAPGPRAAAWRTADGRLQPLGAVYAVRPALTLARERLDGDPSLTGLLRALHPWVRDADAGVTAALRSLDTPEAYAAALSSA